jgi:hypothetical protein
MGSADKILAAKTVSWFEGESFAIRAMSLAKTFFDTQ